VPGYEILSELGRGGMGVVYKARHVTLKRLVALKMIVSGAYAGSEEEARAEAETAARLQHPNIVQVYEVGTHQGRPYMALEFVPGGSLADKLDGTPRLPRQAAELLETLARAVHTAHAAGVVHRDLKPANVLVGERWTLKVADFGLAKRLDGPAQTVTGVIKGTPPYMAPEQAAGQAKEVGPAVDVYALGAILYELLTGRPPFRGTTPLETLLLVQVQEPVPPSRLNLKVPRDLETICLKCLQKAPHKRYASAEALAEDLRRFRAGEPIEARPVGTVERAVKWVRRRPAVAGLLATVVLLVIAGIGVSTYFAFDATKQARQAQKEKGTALAAKADLEAANQQLTISQERLQAAVVRSWLLPLAAQPGPLSAQEAEVLAELAANRDVGLAGRFLDEAVREPALARRLATRSEYIAHALVGLDSRRRREVEQLLQTRLRAFTTNGEARQGLALVLAAVGDLSPSATASATQALTRALAETKDPTALAILAEGMSAVAARLDAGEAGAALTRAMRQTTNPDTLQLLAEALVEVNGRLEPKEAGKALAGAVAILKKAITGAREPGAVRPLAMGLSALAVRLEPAEAIEGTTIATLALAQALPRARDSYVLRALALDLAAVAGRLEASDPVGQLGRQSAFERSARAKTSRAGMTLPWAITGLPPNFIWARPDVKDAATIKALGQTADLLGDALTRIQDPYVLKALARGLLSVSWSLEAKDAASRFARALTATKDPYALRLLALGLSEVSARMEMAELVLVLQPITKALADVKGDEAKVAMAFSMSEMLARVELKGRLKTAAFADIAKFLLTPSGPRAAELMKNPFILEVFAKVLSAIAGNLEKPKEAIPQLCEMADLLLKKMSETEDPYALSALAEGLAAATEVLEPAAAAQRAKSCVALFAKALTETKDPYALEALAEGLAALAARLKPEDATPLAANAASVLARAMAESKDSYALEALAKGLSEVARFLSPRDAARLATDSVVLARAMTENKDIIKRSGLAASLAPLFGRLELAEQVALLKRPLCVGAARPLVLDQLEIRYRRKFADQWDFVRFAEEKRLGLDLAGPPKRK
jgi:hypothetical protein